MKREEVPDDLQAFSQMIDSRKEVHTVPSSEAGGPAPQKVILFRLPKYVVCSPACPEVMVNVANTRYMRIDCLADA